MKKKRLRVHSLLIFALAMMFTTLTTAAGYQAVSAQEEPTLSPVLGFENSSGARHILLDARDFSEIGKAITVIAPDRVAEQQDLVPAPGILSEWSELIATTLLVQSGDNGLDNAIVSMSSYKFASEKTVRNQLENINTLLEREGVQISHDASLLDDASRDLLAEQSTSWQVQTGKDDEDLLAYFLWIQLDNYVIETYIAVEERSEQYGQQILRHLIQQVFTKEAVDVGMVPDAEKPDTSNAARSWLTATANSSLEQSGIHFLAVWNLGSGNNQHYIGPGGDAATCGSSHGCIGSWTWWMNPSYGPSKLGIPKTFLLLDQDRWNGSNYQANVWCC
ncbi:MAG TPA: hypothetical protein PLK31_24615 [Chloroflexota bacterium]|nr:hypothetical protein [Chloroflexota bacterium]